MRYELLKQTHPSYDAGLCQELQDLYEGGYTIAKRASMYMPQIPGETDKAYQARCRQAAYLSYFGQIVDFFTANLFAQEITVTPAADAANPNTPGELPDVDYYTDFAQNADNRGLSFAKLLRCVFTTALVKKCGLVAIDFPAKGGPLATSPYRSRLEEDAAGAARAYAFEVPVEQLVDWCEDNVGGFKWLILRRELKDRETPEQRRELCIQEFKIWRLDGDFARWELYRTRPYKDVQELRDDDDVPLVYEDQTTFRRIPIHRFDVPAGLWVGNKLGTVAKEHYQRRNAMNSAENKSLFAIPVVKLGPEIPAVGGPIAAAQSNESRLSEGPRAALENRGFTVVGKDDDVLFAAPDASCYEVIDKQLQQLVDEMFRVVHQMAASVSSTSVALHRSGQSKQEDKSSTATVLGAYGSLVRDFAKCLYTTISTARDEDVIWTPHGLDNYDAEDRDSLLTEATSIDLVNIPSATFKRQYKTQLALKLIPNIPPETQEQIRQEITDGVEAEQAMSALMQPGALGDDGQDPTATGQPPMQAAANGAATPQRGGVQKPGANGAVRGFANGVTKPAAPAPAQQNVRVATPQGAATPIAGAQQAPPRGSARAATAAPAPSGISKRAATSDPGIADDVYTQLAEDFDKDVLQWVLAADWQGPINVPLEEVDTSGRAQWRATYEPDRVQFFVDRIKAGGQDKPIVMVNEPSDNALLIVDGHHRFLAYEQLGMPVLAYVGSVASIGGPWRKMHASQRRGASMLSNGSILETDEMVEAVRQASGV